MSERIAAAAIKVHEAVISVPRPGRHHTVFRALADAGIRWQVGTETQGFVTSDGRFVDRDEGFQIANAAGQIVQKHGPATHLFSEDMW